MTAIAISTLGLEFALRSSGQKKQLCENQAFFFQPSPCTEVTTTTAA